MQLPQFRGIREAQGLSQRALAARAQVNLTTISRIERGAGAQRYTVYQLAQALGVEPGQLLGAPGRWSWPAPHLRALREASGISQRALALLAHVPPRTISRLEAGDPARRDIIAKLASAFGVAPDDLVAPGGRQGDLQGEQLSC
jgi:transcriptional regulator with XRE-family HTH domain